MDKDMIKLKKDLEKNRVLSARGIGIDIEEVNRFRVHGVSSNFLLYKKIFTEQEIAYCMAKADPYPHFTVRFAAKEAVAKAVGMSMFELNDIEIVNEVTGKPTVIIHSHPEYIIEISLSHTKEHGAAIAFRLS